MNMQLVFLEVVQFITTSVLRCISNVRSLRLSNCVKSTASQNELCSGSSDKFIS